MPEADDTSDSLYMLGWNIHCGGFDSYDTNLEVPSRELAIQRVVNLLHQFRGVEAASLIDAYRWNELYEDEAGMAAHLGYQEARFTLLEDERLNRDAGKNIGIVFATDRRIESSKPLDLDNRQGLGVILDVGKYGLQVANVYLDDLDEKVRHKQITALVANLEPRMPTILVGDFNALRRNMAGASLPIKAKDLAIRSLARMLPRSSAYGSMLRNVNKRIAVPLVESLGFTDTDKTYKRPTFPSKRPMLGVDYVFHNNQVSIDDFRVLDIDRVSDHRPLLFKATTSQ